MWPPSRCPRRPPFFPSAAACVVQPDPRNIGPTKLLLGFRVGGARPASLCISPRTRVPDIGGRCCAEERAAVPQQSRHTQTFIGPAAVQGKSLTADQMHEHPLGGTAQHPPHANKNKQNTSHQSSCTSHAWRQRVHVQAVVEVESKQKQPKQEQSQVANLHFGKEMTVEVRVWRW